MFPDVFVIQIFGITYADIIGEFPVRIISSFQILQITEKQHSQE